MRMYILIIAITDIVCFSPFYIRYEETPQVKHSSDSSMSTVSSTYSYLLSKPPLSESRRLTDITDFQSSSTIVRSLSADDDEHIYAEIDLSAFSKEEITDSSPVPRSRYPAWHKIQLPTTVIYFSCTFTSYKQC